MRSTVPGQQGEQAAALADEDDVTAGPAEAGRAVATPAAPPDAAAPPPEPAPQVLRLVVGRIGKAQGLKGEVTVELRTDDPETRFARGAVLLTEPATRGPLTVERVRMQGQRLILGFAGIEDRTKAETLRNTLLVAEVDPAERAEDPDEFYDHQLVGLRVVTVDGRPVGIVREMIHLPAQDLFAVRRADGREVLIPFVADFVPEVDLASRTVRVDPPPGLLELADPTPTGEQ